MIQRQEKGGGSLRLFLFQNFHGRFRDGNLFLPEKLDTA